MGVSNSRHPWRCDRLKVLEYQISSLIYNLFFYSQLFRSPRSSRSNAFKNLISIHILVSLVTLLQFVEVEDAKNCVIGMILSPLKTVCCIDSKQFIYSVVP